MFPRMAPITLTLVVINVAVFALQYLMGNLGNLLVAYGALWPLDSVNSPYSAEFQPWQMLSYAFLHGSPQHLFFNMLALLMFGSDIERLMGEVRYLLYYGVCVLGAAAAQLLVLKLMGRTDVPTVGASGGVFGILLAFGMAFPRRQIMLLLPPIPMPAWLFVTLYGILELVLGVTGTAQGVAHFAHLGGMAAGLVLILIWRRRRR